MFRYKDADGHDILTMNDVSAQVVSEGLAIPLFNARFVFVSKTPNVRSDWRLKLNISLSVLERSNLTCCPCRHCHMQLAMRRVHILQCRHKHTLTQWREGLNIGAH